MRRVWSNDARFYKAETALGHRVHVAHVNDDWRKGTVVTLVVDGAKLDVAVRRAVVAHRDVRLALEMAWPHHVKLCAAKIG